MKIYQAVQKLLVGDTDRQTGDLISLLSFVESGLKKEGENERDVLEKCICFFTHALFHGIMHTPKPWYVFPQNLWTWSIMCLLDLCCKGEMFSLKNWIGPS
jgi:hypothetical protein